MFQIEDEYTHGKWKRLDNIFRKINTNIIALKKLFRSPPYNIIGCTVIIYITLIIKKIYTFQFHKTFYVFFQIMQFLLT